MRNVEVNIKITNVPGSVRAKGPTFATAISAGLPSLPSLLGDPSSIFAVRRADDDELEEGMHRIIPELKSDLESWELDPYGSGDLTDAAGLVIYDVRQELADIEETLRAEASKRYTGQANYTRVYDLGRDFLDCANALLVYDPDARIKPKKKLTSMFGGDDWLRWIPPIYKTQIVTIRNLATVAKTDSELLLRFEYYFKRPSGLSVHGRALEYADRQENAWKIRTNRFSALRGLSPPFRGKQIPQVHRDLQIALNAGAFGSAPFECDCEWQKLQNTLPL